MAIMNQGKLLFSGRTDDALNLVKDKVWAKKVSKHDLKTYESDYKLISNKLVGGTPLIHVFADSHPGEGFEKANENLEDVFFASIHNLI
jgi:hypothetical protein